eukprot:CAMPEP_0194542406 /NCGR_PEP_ID=MMETSP0253-20130528/83956_1 /TAXON_ID=2966 /ORGANISM="Noctiluca scintillans" /LENGTH=51 /DNA_ID=CAMNT_0039389023 /DNA_START=25 /DNA_END=177 /DNA_ORIENTATION=+
MEVLQVDASETLLSKLHALSEHHRLQFTEVQSRLDALEELVGERGCFSGVP